MNVSNQFPAVSGSERNLRFRTVFQSAAIGIGLCDLSGRITELNPEFSRIFGFRQEELMHAEILELDALQCKFDYKNASENDPSFQLLSELVNEKRASLCLEKCYRRKNGSEFWGHLTMSLGRDPRDQPAFLIAMLSDTNDCKRVQEHLREAEKMEVIGRLAGGVAHDFNNLLTGILLYCDLLSAELDSNRFRDVWESTTTATGGSPAIAAAASHLWQHVEEVRMAGEQGAALTHQLLAIARKQAAVARPVVINEVVASTNNLLHRLIGERIELVSVLDPEAGRVLIDPAQLRQILMNLVLNARDSMSVGGTITLSTRLAEQAPESKNENGKRCNPKRTVALQVKDDGAGMDAQTRSRLFEPFFTTKKPGMGTGLGLATVQRIVSESGGTIEVESEPGHGTCVEIFFRSLASYEFSGIGNATSIETSRRDNCFERKFSGDQASTHQLESGRSSTSIGIDQDIRNKIL
jgi:PAS domain S-box-containing protein